MRTLILITLLLVAGCATTRQGVLDISTEKVKNAEAMREVAENCRSIGLMQLGFIEAALGNRVKELPQEDLAAIKRFRILAEKPELSDYELGFFLGLKVRLMSSVVQEILEKYAPDVIDLFPLIF